MDKIPVNKLVQSTKNVGTFIKENKEVIQTIGNSIPILKDISEKTIQSLKSTNPSKKTKLEKTPYRKQRYTEYLTNIMPKAHSYTYIELIMKKSEVRSFIEQISPKQQSIKIKNPKFSIWKKNWETIFIHVRRYYC